MNNTNTTPAPTAGERYWWLAFAVAIICVAVVAVALTDSRELPVTIIGAVLGVAMTVFATWFLFKGQAKQQLALISEQHAMEQNNRKEAEIFKQKLTTYSSFLDALCEYVKTKSDTARAELQFRTAAIAMHASAPRLVKLNSYIADVMKLFDSSTPDERKLIKALFNIAETFREELYPDSPLIRGDEYTASIDSLASAIDDSPADTPLAEIEAEDRADEKADDTASGAGADDTATWSAGVAALEAAGWHVAVDTAADTIELWRDGSPARISFGKTGRFYAVSATGAEGDVEFSKALKAAHKGSRRANVWSRELTSLPSYGVSNGLTSVLDTNAKARAVVLKWINKLTPTL